MASKCCSIIKSSLPFIILFLSLFQLYTQYTSFVTPRDHKLNEIDHREQMHTYKIGKKILDLNWAKVEECFNDSSLMNINLLKKTTLDYFDELNSKRDLKINKKVYMLFYIIFTDILYIINLYIFYFGSLFAGIIKIIFQTLKFYFSYKRLKESSPYLCLLQIFQNYIDDINLRNNSFFQPQGYDIIDHLCNYVLIFDIFYLIILFKKKCGKKKEDENIIQLNKAQDNEQYSSGQQIIEQDDNDNDNNSNEKENEHEEQEEKDKDDEINNISNNINNDSNNDNCNDNDICNDNNKEKGKIILNEEENEEDDEIDEEPLNEEETK